MPDQNPSLARYPFVALEPPGLVEHALRLQRPSDARIFVRQRFEREQYRGYVIA
jgi:hypothetical protein